MHPFRKAIEKGELDAVLDLLSPDVVFNSPAPAVGSARVRGGMQAEILPVQREQGVEAAEQP